MEEPKTSMKDALLWALSPREWEGGSLKPDSESHAALAAGRLYLQRLGAAAVNPDLVPSVMRETILRVSVSRDHRRQTLITQWFVASRCESAQMWLDRWKGLRSALSPVH
jgi:hypothetical protein